jgi:hypothetical protein
MREPSSPTSPRPNVSRQHTRTLAAPTNRPARRHHVTVAQMARYVPNPPPGVDPVP